MPVAPEATTAPLVVPVGQLVTPLSVTPEDATRIEFVKARFVARTRDPALVIVVKSPAAIGAMYVPANKPTLPKQYLPAGHNFT